MKFEPGKGTTFFIYIPATGIISKIAKVEPELKETEALVGSILLMDDEQMVRDVAGDLLKASGTRLSLP